MPWILSLRVTTATQSVTTITRTSLAARHCSFIREKERRWLWGWHGGAEGAKDGERECRYCHRGGRDKKKRKGISVSCFFVFITYGLPPFLKFTLLIYANIILGCSRVRLIIIILVFVISLSLTTLLIVLYLCNISCPFMSLPQLWEKSSLPYLLKINCCSLITRAQSNSFFNYRLICQLLS